MRFNATELKQLAFTAPCKFEGSLKLCEKKGKLWNKTDGKYIWSYNVFKSRVWLYISKVQVCKHTCEKIKESFAIACWTGGSRTNCLLRNSGPTS